LLEEGKAALKGLAEAFLSRKGSSPSAKENLRLGRAGTHAETTLIVGEGVRVKGTLGGCDTLIVRGLVETSFKARSLQVLEGGGCVGTVEAENAEIAGTFDGVLAVQGCLKVRSTGRLTGTIHYARISIEEGGEISGGIQVGGGLPPPLRWPESKPRSAVLSEPVDFAETPESAPMVFNDEKTESWPVMQGPKWSEKRLSPKSLSETSSSTRFSRFHSR